MINYTSPQQTNNTHEKANNMASVMVVSNDKSSSVNHDLREIASIGSWDDSDREYNNKNHPAAATTGNTSTIGMQAFAPMNHDAAPSVGATTSYQNRTQHMPQWMSSVDTNIPTAHQHHHYEPAPDPLSRMSPNSYYSNPSYYYQRNQQLRPSPTTLPPSNSNAHHYHSSSSYQQQNHHYHSNLHPHRDSYNNYYSYHDDTIEIPPEHTPTWQHILPSNYFTKRKEQRLLNNNNSEQYKRQRRRKFTLSLINLWEFTITTESIDIYGQSTEEVFHGLRAPIKKIAKNHIGRDGRKGAIFERGIGGEGILPDDPTLKQATAGLSSEGGRNSGDSMNQPNSAGQGKWRIPLGAYQALFTYLTREGSVEGIPPEQLRVATLGRERADKKEYPSVKHLLGSGVSPVVAKALAPYQRGGVEFIIEKEGKALLADEMGLGKTIQAIAAMSAFKSEWPLLVLCPSSARYHWETEFRHWMGRESQIALPTSPNNDANDDDNNIINLAGNKNIEPELRHKQINVLTSGKDRILTSDNSTQVVICSIGLIVNLVNSQRIVPGMFRAVVVDESHVLKNKTTKRTRAVLPLLDAAERCLLLSGTPALAKPSELWPQLSVLGGRREDGSRYPSGIMCDYDYFMSKYVRGHSKTRLAELHTLLTSTVMIRRMKLDMLKNLPPKIREKAYIKIEDEKLQIEFAFYLRVLKEGKGLLGKLAKKHEICSEDQCNGSQFLPGNGDEPLKNKEVLHHLYNISGRCKVARITKMLKNWIADPTKGKLCIFAHHLYVLDELARGAGLSNSVNGHAKFIRIDGSTSPKSRQEQILTFQTDPTVRIALLGITAAGVAVTLTASSTVWFAELFWTPAIMVQAEDRCHRIGQQAPVRCLYFIAKGTLDEVLWKLIEKKFRDLGEFVEGKENMGIALERELEDDEEDEILKVEEEAPDEAAARKRKAENLFDDLLDADDAEIKAEIDELVHEEEEMLMVIGEEEEDDPDADTDAVEEREAVSSPKREAAKSSNAAISLLDDDDDDDGDREALTFSEARQRVQDGRAQKIDPFAQCVSENISFREVQYPAYKPLGLLMVSFSGRIMIKGYTSDESSQHPNKPEIGAIIVAVNEMILPVDASFSKVLRFIRKLSAQGPVTLLFAEETDFMPWFRNVMIPRFEAVMIARNSISRKNVIEID